MLIIVYFAVKLVADLQRLKNPNNNYNPYTVDEAIIAALDISVDIIKIFMIIILFLGGKLKKWKN